MVLHSRGCGRVARRRIQRNDMGIPGGAWLPGIPLYSRSVVVPAGVLPGRPGGAFPLPGVPVGRNAPGTPFLYPNGCFPPPIGGFWTPEGPWAGGSLHLLGVLFRWEARGREDCSSHWEFRDAEGSQEF